MSRTNNAKRTTKRFSMKHVTDFDRALAAADRVAGDVLANHGVMLNDKTIDAYETLIEPVAIEEFGSYAIAQADNVVTYEEHWHKLMAAHLIGVALGLRIAGMSAKFGGAR